MLQHIMISGIGDGVDVRRHLSTFIISIGADHVIGVDWQIFIGIDCYQKKARVGLVPERKKGWEERRD